MLNRSIAAFSLILMLICCKSQPKINPDFLADITAYRAEQIENLSLTDASPLSTAAVKNLSFYEPDETFRVISTVEKLKPKESITIDTYSGIEKEFIEYAKLTFSVKGKAFILITHKNLKSMRMPQYRNKMFLMFTDMTTGVSTYGGGRYIYIDESELVDGMIPLDFNKAFNPYCAYSDGFNCPIPPRENDLAIKIEAGEKDFNK